MTTTAVANLTTARVAQILRDKCLTMSNERTDTLAELDAPELAAVLHSANNARHSVADMLASALMSEHSDSVRAAEHYVTEVDAFGRVAVLANVERLTRLEALRSATL